MTAKVFEAAPGISAPRSVIAVEFDEATKVLTVPVNFKPRARLAVSGHEGLHPVHDTVVWTYRHLSFFQENIDCSRLTAHPPDERRKQEDLESKPCARFGLLRKDNVPGVYMLDPYACRCR